MKSFLTALCLVLAVIGVNGTALAKDSDTKTTVESAQIDKSKALVNINKADANTLIYYLKGIGEVKADAIVAYRKENGSFKSTDDLLKVTGIGEATLDGLKKNISTTKGETTAPKVVRSGKKTTSSKSAAKAKVSQGDEGVVEKDESTSTSKTKGDVKEAKSSKLLSSKDDKKKKTSKKSSSKEEASTADKDVTSKVSKSKKSAKKVVDCKDPTNKKNKACKSASKKSKTKTKSSKDSKKEAKNKTSKVKTKTKKKDENKK